MYNGYEEIKQAANSLGKAEKDYIELLKTFISIGHDEPPPPPNRILDKKGLEELDQAENNKKQAQEYLNKLIKLYLPNYPKPHI